VAQPLELDSTWNKGGNNYTFHHEVPERNYRSARVANSIVSRTSDSDMLRPESTDVRNCMPGSQNKDMGAKGPMVVSMVLQFLFFTYKHCLSQPKHKY
jgi:hypothetical protein